MKVWITKYALTKGIFLVEAERCPDINNDMVSQTVPKPEYGAICYHGEGRDWHTTFDSAVKRAETMREKKIKSLRKSISQLQARDFSREVPYV